MVTKTSLPVPSQVWCEAAGRDLTLAEAPARSLLFVLEGYFGNQLPALAVHLVREALMAEDALSGGWPAALSAPPLPSIPDVACDVASQASVVLPGAGRTPRPGSAWGSTSTAPAAGTGGGGGVGTRRPAGAPAHRVIQVQVRVKLGDQVVTLVQLGNFPWEPEDFTEDGRKGELGEHWPVGGRGPPGSGLPRQTGGWREVAGDCDSRRGGGGPGHMWRRTGGRSQQGGDAPSRTSWSLQGSLVGASASLCLKVMALLSRTEGQPHPCFPQRHARPLPPGARS